MYVMLKQSKCHLQPLLVTSTATVTLILVLLLHYGKSGAQLELDLNSQRFLGHCADFSALNQLNQKTAYCSMKIHTLVTVLKTTYWNKY